MPTWDIAILGAGPAGLAAAIRCRQRGASAIVLSKERSRGVRLGESLGPAAGPLLRELGCWEAFLAAGHRPCPGNAWSWGSARLDFHSFTMDPRGHAWHIDRAAFEAGLAARAEALGVGRERLLRTPELGGEAGDWRLELGAGEVVRARALIDASGRGAALARALGVSRVVLDSQVAVLAHFRPRGRPLADHSSLVEAAPEGWWYSAAGPDGTLALLLFTTRAIGRALLDAPARMATLIAASPHTAARLAGHERCAALKLVAAGTERLERAAGPSWRACGDAALTYDPLASHGLTFALASGRDAADSLADVLAGTGTAAELERDYAARIAAAARSYTRARQRIYAAELRWPRAPYWRARWAQPEDDPSRAPAGGA